MSDIPPIQRSVQAELARINARKAAAQQSAFASRGSGDRVEVSKVAQLRGKLADIPDVRQDLVDRVRSEIDAGDYETDDKIDAVVDAIFNDIFE